MRLVLPKRPSFQSQKYGMPNLNHTYHISTVAMKRVTESEDFLSKMKNCKFSLNNLMGYVGEKAQSCNNFQLCQYVD